MDAVVLVSESGCERIMGLSRRIEVIEAAFVPDLGGGQIAGEVAGPAMHGQ